MKKLLACIAVSTVLFTGCSFLNNEGIVKVNDQVITKQEFNKELDKTINSSFLKSFGGSKNFLKSNENPMYPVIREKVVNELVIKKLIDEELAKRNIDASKEDVQKELESVIDKVGSKEELNRILKQRGISNEQFMEDMKTQIKIKKLVNSIEKINISDAETLKYYNENKKQFSHGEQVRASHILISADILQIIRKLKQKNPEMTPEVMNAEVEKYMAIQKAKAEGILAEVKSNPENFEKIAKQKSDDKASGERGGDLGFFPREAMVPEFSNAAFSMKPNTISNLVQTNYGYHIIKVTDRMAPGTTPYVKVKDEIKYYLETVKQIEILKNLTSGLMKTAKIEYLDDSFNPAKAVKVDEDNAKEQESAKEQKETK